MPPCNHIPTISCPLYYEAIEDSRVNKSGIERLKREGCEAAPKEDHFLSLF